MIFFPRAPKNCSRKETIREKHGEKPENTLFKKILGFFLTRAFDDEKYCPIVECMKEQKNKINGLNGIGKTADRTRKEISGGKTEGFRMSSAIERVKRVLEVFIRKVNEILEDEMAAKEGHAEAPAEVAHEEAPEVAHEEAPEVAHEEAKTEIALLTETKAEEGAPPEPKGTKPRVFEAKKETGKISKSELVRQCFRKNPEARNQEVIEYIKEKHGIELQPSLVSTVKISMKIPKSRPGRIKGSQKSKIGAVRKEKKSRDGLSMTACVTRVMSKSKKGMQVDEVLDRVKNLYSYKGSKGEEGLKNVVYQALYGLSLKKSRRGWEGSAPVLIHDDENHTWKLNPKAKRKIA